MCGIAGIIVKTPETVNLSEKLVLMNEALRHRGPDGEGYLLANANEATPYFNKIKPEYSKPLNYLPQAALPKHSENAVVSFTHRRLSIIDLSECGHQPMANTQGDLWIVFNGEIYNYLELRDELKALGYNFVSASDTEVILTAYQQWGIECVSKFNGMWAFCIYDMQKQICFASRDRFGVKPFYYVNTNGLLAFASEQKALVHSGIVKAKMRETALKEYLLNGLLENEPKNFFEEIEELWPGTNLVYDLNTKKIQTHLYYHLKQQVSHENDHLTENELIEKIRETFVRSVRLRLRSDVEVGTCLSGGIDSSALAVTMSELTGKSVHCFTSVFRNQPFNEEQFANLVANKINARYFKTEPQLEGFIKEVDDLVYSQDVPIWDTSTYAQFKVMELAKINKIKVVLDGQGSDELFAGYHHHFIAKWNNLIAQGKYIEAIKEISLSRKTIPGAWQFFAKEKIKQKYYPGKKYFSQFLKSDFIASSHIRNPQRYFNNVNEQLISDVYDTRLKTFLKCEDRCGMWHSVESRTPFSDDIDLINLLFSFNGNKKIKEGVSKYLLRESVKEQLPTEIYHRYDKKGFETPMQKWMEKLKPQMLSSIREADFDFVNKKGIETSNMSNPFHYKLLFKFFILSRWKKVFNA